MRGLDLATCDKISDVYSARRSTLQTAWLQERLRRIHWKRRPLLSHQGWLSWWFFLGKKQTFFVYLAKKSPTFFYTTRKSTCGRKWSCRHAISSVLVFSKEFPFHGWMARQPICWSQLYPAAWTPTPLRFHPPHDGRPLWPRRLLRVAMGYHWDLSQGIPKWHGKWMGSCSCWLELLNALEIPRMFGEIWWKVWTKTDQYRPTKKTTAFSVERTFGFKFQRLLVVDLRVWTSKWNLWQIWTFHCEVFKSLCVFSPKNP